MQSRKGPTQPPILNLRQIPRNLTLSSSSLKPANIIPMADQQKETNHAKVEVTGLWWNQTL